MGNNLRKLRDERGWTHQETADKIGISRGMLIKIERGERSFKPHQVSAAAKAFGVPEAEVHAPSVVPVVGIVGAGGAIDTEWESLSEPLFEIELPILVGDDAIGFEISGDSMWPRYDPGDVIVVSRIGEPLENLLDFEAVVRVGSDDSGGARYFKRIIRGATPGLFDLESYNAPPIRGQHVAWGASLIVKVPAKRWRKLNGEAVKRAVKKVKSKSK